MILAFCVIVVVAATVAPFAIAVIKIGKEDEDAETVGE